MTYGEIITAEGIPMSLKFMSQLHCTPFPSCQENFVWLCRSSSLFLFLTGLWSLLAVGIAESRAYPTAPSAWVHLGTRPTQEGTWDLFCKTAQMWARLQRHSPTMVQGTWKLQQYVWKQFPDTWLWLGGILVFFTAQCCFDHKENQSPILNESCKNPTSRKESLYVKHNSKLPGNSY